MSISNLNCFYFLLSKCLSKKKVKLCQVWAKVFKIVSRTTQAPCGRIVPNKVSILPVDIHVPNSGSGEISGWVTLSVPFCPYIMGAALRGQTDPPTPSGSCSVPSFTEQYGGAWNNINCVACLELAGFSDLWGLELISDLILLFWFEVIVTEELMFLYKDDAERCFLQSLRL